MNHKCDGCRYKGEHQEMMFRPFGVCLKESELAKAEAAFRAKVCPHKEKTEMTESEIMKALENCSDGTGKSIIQSVIALINRKNAENEKLCSEIDELIIAKDQLFDEAEALIKTARAEAIKEFAERMKEDMLYSKFVFPITTKERTWNSLLEFYIKEGIEQIAKGMGVETNV